MALAAQHSAPPMARKGLDPPFISQGASTRISPASARPTATHWNPLSLSPRNTQAISSSQNGMV